MNLRKITARTAVVGVTTALAAGALVGVGTTAANAAEVSNTYTCVVPGIVTFDSTLTVIGDLPVPQYSAGAPAPAGIVSVLAGVDPATAGQLAGYMATDLEIKDFAFDLGGTPVSVPLAGPITDGVWNGTGTNAAFVTPAPGLTAAKFPQAMTVSAYGVFGNPDAFDIPCTLKTGETAATLASIELLRQNSATTVKAPKKAVKKGKAVSITVTSASTTIPGLAATGTVSVKDGKKVIVKSAKLNKAGKAVINLGKKLKVGTHKLTVTYKGTPSIKGSVGKAVVKVAK